MLPEVDEPELPLLDIEPEVAAVVGAAVAPPDVPLDCVEDEDEDEPWLHAASTNKATTAMRERFRIVRNTPILR